MFPDNTMFTADGQFVGLIDFEEICVGPALLDVAFTLVGCCYELDGERPARLRPSLVRHLVHAYEAGRGALAAVERQELGLYLELAAVILIFWRYRHFNVRLGDAATAADRRRYRELLPLLTAVVDHEGRPRTAGHVALLELGGAVPPVPPPAPLAQLLWPA